ncbi:MAG: substrate-binding domain-containing protein [Bacteroidota bacterium]
MIARVLIVMSIVLLACRSNRAPQEAVTTTNGPLSMIVSEELFTTIDTVAKEFARIYPGIRPTVGAAPTREVIAHLLNDSVRTIVVDRPFNDEERRVVEGSGLVVVGTQLAWDALVIVVHAENRFASITPAAVGAIVSGSVSRWSQVPGSSRSDAIEFVSTGRNSGLHEQIMRRVSGGRPLKTFAAGSTQAELVQYVGRSPRAMALVSLAAVRERPATARILPVETVVDSVSGRRELVSPSQLSVYEGRYPFRTEIVAYNAERRIGPGAGFAAFALTTPGQKIVQNSGLVPAVIPNRVIQLTAE